MEKVILENMQLIINEIKLLIGEINESKKPKKIRREQERSTFHTETKKDS